TSYGARVIRVHPGRFGLDTLAQIVSSLLPGNLEPIRQAIELGRIGQDRLKRRIERSVKSLHIDGFGCTAVYPDALALLAQFRQLPGAPGHAGVSSGGPTLHRHSHGRLADADGQAIRVVSCWRVRNEAITFDVRIRPEKVLAVGNFEVQKNVIRE